MSEAYPSIFWQRGWTHQKYYGWRIAVDAPGFRVLEKSTGPVRRCLVLSSLDDKLDAKLREAKLPDARTQIVLHDFNDQGHDQRLIAGKAWRRAKDSERLLNVATFVVDLDQSEDALWQAFGAKSRNVVRKAKESGVTVRLTRQQGPDLERFFVLYQPIVEQFGLSPAPAEKLREMFRNGDVFSIASDDAHGETLAVNLVYRCDTHAIYLYGASVANVAGGIGQYLQWETIRALRADDCRWYDLGGLPSLDPNNGIHRFKKSIGGALVHLGCEYIFTPPLVSGLLSGRDWARGLTRTMRRQK